MTKKTLGAKELADRIIDEVQSSLPSQLQRQSTRAALHGKVERLLNNAGFQGDYPAQSRSVTILLSDIRGFTSIAETYSAMVVMDLLNRYFSAMTEVIVRHGGTIDKLMGDSIMVLFGAPETGQDDVARAIACAVEMQQAMSEFNVQSVQLGLPELFMGIGINTGNVVAGALGSADHREYTVIGDEVNLASRIEAQSLRGQILISENTYMQAKPYVLVGEPNHVQVKGKRDQVCLYELLGTTRPRALTVPRREIRKSPRITVKMPCHFQRLEGKTVAPNLFCGEVIDISYNGLLIVSPIPLEPYAEIKMAMSLQLLGNETTDVYARILSTDLKEQGYVSSLEFTSIDVAGQRTIKQFVDNQLYQS